MPASDCLGMMPNHHLAIFFDLSWMMFEGPGSVKLPEDSQWTWIKMIRRTAIEVVHHPLCQQTCLRSCTTNLAMWNHLETIFLKPPLKRVPSPFPTCFVPFCTISTHQLSLRRRRQCWCGTVGWPAAAAAWTAAGRMRGWGPLKPYEAMWNHIWLVVWNIWISFHILGIVTPTDELIFFRGVQTTNHVFYQLIVIKIWMLHGATKTGGYSLTGFVCLTNSFLLRWARTTAKDPLRSLAHLQKWTASWPLVLQLLVGKWLANDWLLD